MGRLRAEAPEGWHVPSDAPARVRVERDGVTVADLSLLGSPAALRFPVLEGAVVAVTLPVCADSGGECRPVDLRSSPLAGTTGRLALAVARAAPPTGGHGRAVRLIDFAAVWCPPCTLLATEVLHDPENAGALAGLQLETVDVDRPDSWTLKDRYQVGGYPTLIAVDAEGGEVARLVGYPGESATLAWLAGLATTRPLAELEAGVPLEGAEAARAARRLAESDRDAAAEAYFPAAVDGEDLRIARLLVRGERADAEWLFAHAPPGDWVFAALKAAPDRQLDAARMLPDLDPVLAADLLDVLAAGPGPDPGLALRAAAIVALEGALSGELEHDKAHVGYLADLYAGIGRLDAGLALFAPYLAAWPQEFTWDHAASRLLLDAGRYSEAEARGRTALEKAWGDQRLRAVQPLASAIAAQGRTAEAVALLDEVVQTTPAPPGELQVRTHRYLATVAALRAQLLTPTAP